MVKAVVIGASGGIGQPLSLLLKTNPLISELSLYDVVNTPGVAADLSHINTPAKVTGFVPENPKDLAELGKALDGAQIAIIPAGIPRKPGMTRDDLFKINAGIVRDIASGIAQFAPNAFILVISNPVNSTVPIVAEVLKKAGVFNPKKLFGVTTLDVVRASTFVAEELGDISASQSISVPVVGGHSGETIIPLFSQSNQPLPPSLTTEKRDALLNRVQFGGDEVVEAKKGAGSATLSMAFAGFEFAVKVLHAISGSAPSSAQELEIVAPSYVSLDADKEGGEKLIGELGQPLEFFSSRVKIGKDGVEKIYELGEITEFEKGLVQKAIPLLKKSIDAGVNFVAENPPQQANL